jgi:hypothetical protein
VATQNFSSFNSLNTTLKQKKKLNLIILHALVLVCKRKKWKNSIKSKVVVVIVYPRKIIY